MAWSFTGITRRSPDPSALANFYGRLPWSLSVATEEGPEPLGLTLEFRCGDDPAPGIVRDPGGHALRVRGGPAPTRATPAWFEGVTFLTPEPGELCAFYRSLPGAVVQVDTADADGFPVGIFRFGSARIAVMRAATPSWHIEVGLADDDLFQEVRAAGFELGTTEHLGASGDAAWGESEATLQDPEGVELELEVQD